MTNFRPKLWTSVSVAIVLGAAVAGCGGESGENREKGPETKPAEGSSTVPPPAAGEGGEGGVEGGAKAAYLGVPDSSRAALALAHLKGFYLVAQKTIDPDEAGALAGQGLLEVYDVQAPLFKSTGIDEAKLRKAAQTGKAGDLQAAINAIEAAEARAGGDPVAVTKGMLSIASRLYEEAGAGGVVDPTEYQHSYGASLATGQAFAEAEKVKPATRAAAADMAKLLAFWPSSEAPKSLASSAQVSGQAARVELALS